MRKARAVAVSVILVVGLLAMIPGAAIADTQALGSDTVECNYPYEVTDGTDSTVSLNESPDEIVVLHASSAQVVHDIGAWDRVTGAPVAPFTAYLDDHDTPIDVTDDLGTPELEEVVNLSPDLVIAAHVGDMEEVDALRDEGLTVYMGPTPASVDDIAQKVEAYGELIGQCEEASETVGWMNDELADIDATTNEIDTPIAYYEMGDGWTAGDGTFQQDAIEVAGADNLGGIAGVQGWEPVNEEEVLNTNPDWIIYSDAAEEPPISPAIEETTAIQQNQTIAVNSNYFSQAGPRIMLPISEMATAFAETDTEEEPAPEPSDDDSNGDDNGDETIPGFGIIVAGISLISTITIYRRQ